jgi:predicted HTH domain antitoxin
MNTSTTFQEIAAEIQLFDNIEQKEQFIFVVGALVSRIISLHKAAEFIEMDSEIFLKILELIGIDFSYLIREDIDREKIVNLYENCF